jgi:hypothetical protein
MADDLYGHPFRAIWQQLAGNLGITTERMHQNQLDQTAQQQQELTSANEALATVIQSADPEQQQVAAQMMRDRAQAASANITAIQNNQQPQQLPNAAALVSPFYGAMEQRRQGLEDASATAAYEQLKALHSEYHTGLTTNQSAIDKVNTEADTVLQLAGPDGLGSDDKAVQAKFRKLLDASAADLSAGDIKGGEGPINKILGALLGAGESHVYSPDEISKGVSAWRMGQLGTLTQQRSALTKSALAHGFQLDEGGGLADLNVPSYGHGASPTPVGGSPSTPPPPAGTTPVKVDPNAMGGRMAVGSVVGGAGGHMLGHALIGGALEGAGLGRLAGPLGMAAGAVIGGLGAAVGGTTLDERIHQVTGGDAFETGDGKIVNAQGQPVPLPRGLADQVARRSRARREKAQRATNP